MHALLKRLGLSEINSGAWLDGARETSGERLASINPSTGEVLAEVQLATRAEYEALAEASRETFARWRMLPAPKRGELMRLVGEALRAHKEDLGALIALEMGKIRAEGEGEVQESIDIADFAVGLSRQLYGLSMHSERPRHRMYEQWHPLGPIGVITAFNFPNAVWAWNAMIAAVCGDTVIWKPSVKVPLTAIATHKIVDEVMRERGWGGVFALVIGADAEVGEAMIHDRRLPLISATGSTRMGRHVGQAVAARLGRCLLELGGNNAIIVTESADMDLAVRGVLFGAVGTAGQRCTSTRRVFLHESVAEAFTEKLIAAYGQVRIGDPLDEGTLMGPLIDGDAVDFAREALAEEDYRAARRALEPLRDDPGVEDLWWEAVNGYVHAERERAGQLFLEARDLPLGEERARAIRAVLELLEELAEDYPGSDYEDALERNIGLVRRALEEAE